MSIDSHTCVYRNFVIVLHTHYFQKKKNMRINNEKFCLDTQKFESILTSLGLGGFIFHQLVPRCQKISNQTQLYSSLCRSSLYARIILGTLIKQYLFPIKMTYNHIDMFTSQAKG